MRPGEQTAGAADSSAPGGFVDEPEPSRLSEMVRGQLAERPYVVIGAALGIGFALGGGWRLIGRNLFSLAGKFAVGAFITPALEGRFSASGAEGTGRRQ